MINRYIQIEKLVEKKRVLIIYGPRRVGKTTLLKQFLNHTGLRSKLISGENIETKLLFDAENIHNLNDFVSGYDLLAIDEAQATPKIGLGLKLMIDHIPGLQIVVTVSSSFDLKQKTGEPLTGRKKTVVLFPVSLLELTGMKNPYEIQKQLPDYLIYGLYPEVITAKTKKEKEFILRELADSYLLRDVFSIERLRAPLQLVQLLKMLAFQIGNEVSLNELAANIKMDVKTVARYLDILENSFVIKRVGGFSRNLRNEIITKAKYYFYDTGIRNAVISQFQNIQNRSDTGALFENFMVMERFKFNEYKAKNANIYFWRTHDGNEIDLVEERNGKLLSMEFKWNDKKKAKPPGLWKKTYPDAKFKVIDRENFLKIME